MRNSGPDVISLPIVRLESRRLNARRFTVESNLKVWARSAIVVDSQADANSFFGPDDSQHGGIRSGCHTLSIIKFAGNL